MITSLLWGQGEITTDFSMIGGSATAIDASQLRKEGERFENANRVYQRLIAAKGDKRFTPPAFYITLGEDHFAFLQSDGLSIGLEEKAYDLLMELGEDALAAVLGHELSHFYEKHGFAKDMLANFTDERTITALAKVKSALGDEDAVKALVDTLSTTINVSWERLVKLSNETEADYLGGYLAYSAGYRVDKLPEMYAHLYAGYKIADTIFGYGTLQERMQLATETQEKLNDFIDLYEVANLLIAVDRFADARVLYKYILREYQGREVYNNLGVLTVLEAMAVPGAPKEKFLLPLELDLSLGSGTKLPPGMGAEEYVKQLLREAQYYFTSAIGMDADYAPAYLNLACVHYLLDDFDRASFFANIEARQRAAAAPDKFPKLVTDAEILLALITFDSGMEAPAIASLEALKDKSLIAATNLAIARGESPGEDFESAEGPEWYVSEMEARDIPVKTQDINKSKDLRVFEDDKLRVWDESSGLNNARIYRFKPRLELNRPPIFFMITSPGYSEMNFDEMGVGSTAAEIREAYGQPGKVVSTVNGEIWAYESTILIFDTAQKVRRYAIYRVD